MAEFSLLEKIFIYAIPVVFAITVHEVAHGWVAKQLGDRTADLMGRLTLNPVRHVDPVGTVLVPLVMLMFSNFIFGWAKPVPVDWRNLRHPRRDMALVAAAGPGANLVMALFWVLLAKMVILTTSGDGLAGMLVYMAFAGITINVALIALNLLPLPPLDGSRVVAAMLPVRLARRYGRLERYGLPILLVLLMTGALNHVIPPAVTAAWSLARQFLSS